MKRFLLSVPIFAITFVLGYFLVPGFDVVEQTFQSVRRDLPKDVLAPKEIAFRYEGWSYPAAAKDDFDPEFRDLPNFDEIDYPWNDKLIDLMQFEGGIYRESEVIAKTGENWLTLVERNGETSLVPAKAKVRRLDSTSWPGDEKDVRLSFTKSGYHILALRNVAGVLKGRVDTVYRQPSQEEIDRWGLDLSTMEVGSSSKLDLAAKRYILRASTGKTKDGTELAVLVLTTETQEQVISSVPYARGEGNFVGNLLWAGDLDRDGKLDLYFEPYNEKGGMGSQLFVSSHARPNELVKMVATFGVAGC